MRVLIVLTLVVASLSPTVSGALCGRTSVGLVPLTDMGEATWLGHEGGLYPGGSNERPPLHAAAGDVAASLVVPRSPLGLPDPVGGKVVMLSIGMSNTRSEFLQFVALANADPERDPRVRVVNGAIGGQPASTIANPNAAYWSNVDQLLAQAGVTPEQVQVVWLKQADPGPSGDPAAHAQVLRAELDAIVDILVSRFDHLRIVYASSRIYAGYASTALNPEPYAYASGFSVKWLVEDRMLEAPSPWVTWGPYLWADGLVPRSDGVTWSCSEFAADGTHPNAAGARKVAQMLLEFVHEDATASWYRG